MDCSFSFQVWNSVFRWLGVSLVQQHYSQFGLVFREKNLKILHRVIWHCTCWCIWLHHNKIMFQNGRRADACEIIQHIHALSWTWARYKGSLSSGLSFGAWCSRTPFSYNPKTGEHKFTPLTKKFKS